MEEIFDAISKSGQNLFSALVYIKNLLSHGEFLRPYFQHTKDYMFFILNEAYKRSMLQDLVTPLEEDAICYSKRVNGSTAPIDLAYYYRDKDFLTNQGIQVILFQKWDPAGSFEYFGKLNSFVFAFGAMLTYYLHWCILFPFMLTIRHWSEYWYNYSQIGRTDISPRVQYHIPFNRWLAVSITEFVFLIIYTIQAFQQTITPEMHILDYVSIIWSGNIVVEDIYLYFARDLSVNNGWSIADFVSGLALFLFSLAKVFCISISESACTQTLDVARTLLAVCAIPCYARVLAFFELNTQMGSLLQTIYYVLVVDFPHFMIILFLVFIGFAVCFKLLFASICVQQTCITSADLGYHSPNMNLGDFIITFATSFLNIGDLTAAYVHKTFSLIILFVYLFFANLVLSNIFIAMLSSRFALYNERGIIENKYRMARIIIEFGNKEAIWPPMRIFDFSSWLLRRIVGLGLPSKIKYMSPANLFAWYHPKDADSRERIRNTRRDVVNWRDLTKAKIMQ